MQHADPEAAAQGRNLIGERKGEYGDIKKSLSKLFDKEEIQEFYTPCEKIQEKFLGKRDSGIVPSADGIRIFLPGGIHGESVSETDE